jgi:hypothetical protein
MRASKGLCRRETEEIGAFGRLSHGVVAHVEEEVVVYSVHVIILARLLFAGERAHTGGTRKRR